MTKRPILLGVNVDHVATLRQARGVRYPDPVHAAMLAEQAGADGITIHLREDRRHIQPRDVRIMKDTLQTRMNLEMAAIDEMIQLACEIKPAYCCLVPEKRAELTTEGGLDVKNQFSHIKKTTQQLQDQGIEVSLFIDPVAAQIEAAKETGATIIELQTGTYADAQNEKARLKALSDLQLAAKLADEMGLQVNAGHGLHYHNVQDIAAMGQLVELNIGHAIVAHALMVGFAKAVREMKELMVTARNFS